ncbi:rifamycin-inactivating phosphotransferase [Dactylosporangium sucinum]|uniref:Rifampicin phosphotransferase n=1 Tax=Dactylosporangium sucinum TaxID=1424081 RepID=A0A917X533_9ACTN|nr:rifamycin-inactivating phosphotransferase [Dactylosporangium sucinum]GGM67426.1 putative phosphoenolpyruvate synthase [Dactylosporangium sucinum]
MSGYVLEFHEIDKTSLEIAGGKGAHLAELSRIAGVRVPAGFCVTTAAYQRVLADAPSIDDQLRRLSRLKPDDRDAIRTLSAEIRRTIEGIAIPGDLAEAVTAALARSDAGTAYAVRSSATAEDLPTASFAGQQDSYLNIVGPAEVLRHISRCWASLFTERAVTYRLHNGFTGRVHMAVVVQQMVFPQAAGILFTADPVTSDRKVVSIDASFGLGEALVGGLVNPDVYKVRAGQVTLKEIGTKQRAIHAAPDGGTREQEIAPELQQQPALSDEQIVRLAALGRQIEAHFGSPQDIEWCLADDAFQVVQSRPITTLFPIPAVADQDNHVYFSVGHQQMMTDPMKPLGLSIWQLTTPGPLSEAGGRLFADITYVLASPGGAAFQEALGRSDPLIGDALRIILERDGFLPVLPEQAPGGMAFSGPPEQIPTDPAIVADLIARSEASLARVQREISTKSGTELLDFILADVKELAAFLLDPHSLQVINAAMGATWWLNDQMQTLLGEKNAADALTQSAPGNVTSEMGLALLDVADAIRPYPEVVDFLEHVEDEGYLDKLPTVAGGTEARDAIAGYLDKYGMRCVGEIDITRPRWIERPTSLVPMILANVKSIEPGDVGAQRFEQGLRKAREKEQELLERLQDLPDGEQKAEEAKAMIDRVRTFVGYREYPKYHMVGRYIAYKQALLEEADRLVAAGVLREKDDIYFLSLTELHEVVHAGQADAALIRSRRDAFRSYQALTPPRVLTSDGEVVTGTYRRDDLPDGALAGLPVSAGTIEGRARVILDIADADLETGDILVTTFTDPSWAPAFVVIAGLVTEVGGLMTHGAVVAREYGLPAVVGVENATTLIRDKQQIRVHGSDGYIELLP